MTAKSAMPQTRGGLAHACCPGPQVTTDQCQSVSVTAHPADFVDQRIQTLLHRGARYCHARLAGFGLRGAERHGADGDHEAEDDFTHDVLLVDSD